MTSAPLPESAAAETAAHLARLFERHGEMVYGLCRTMLRDLHEAEDATQQTFLSAYSALLGGARVHNEGAWLATIARNDCRARISAAMRTPLSVDDQGLAGIPAPTDDAERSAQAEALRSAFADLPERQREAVVLRDLYGLRYREVATALGLSVPATEALLFRARRAMRRRLRPIVTTALVVPLSVQEGLTQAIPGFGAAAPTSVVAAAAGGGIFAKLTAGPVAAKMATAAVAVTTVGTAGSVQSEQAGLNQAERPGLVTTVGSNADEDGDSSGHTQGGQDDRGQGADDGSNGPGGGEGGEFDDDKSSPGSPGADQNEPDGTGSDPANGSSRGDSPSGSQGDDRSERSESASVDISRPGEDSSGPVSSSGPGPGDISLANRDELDSGESGTAGSGSRSGDSSGSESGGSDDKDADESENQDD